MDLDPATIVVGFIVGSIGFVAFYYGKKLTRFPQMGIGALLMFLPFVVGNPLLLGGIAAGLLGLLFVAVRLGW
jgi:hypothetical protein